MAFKKNKKFHQNVDKKKSKKRKFKPLYTIQINIRLLDTILRYPVLSTFQKNICLVLFIIILRVEISEGWLHL